MIVRLLLIQSGQSALAPLIMILELAMLLMTVLEIAGATLRHRVELHVLFEQAGAGLLPDTADAARFVTDAVKATTACLVRALPVGWLLHGCRRGFDLGWDLGGNATATYLLLLKLITAANTADIPVACV